jgi:phosphoribosyl-ATP pyrophosphohydrolase
MGGMNTLGMDLDHPWDIDAYADWTWTTWGKDRDPEVAHAAFGFAEEAGEVMGVFKREQRGEGFDQDKFIKEMGDVLYYWCRLCIAKGVKPSQIMATNKTKLLDRKARGAIKGSGDNR